ncbi:taste receptor type 1 member 1-like [Tiliqua scincoides]|uniref:taste receptor type 1 member 1-like n=1 Tax=Tiliqua scincoides TaxID=71010 RepID=UPI003463310E
MRLAVEEINNSSALLPGITLGYHIWDTCQENLNLQATFELAQARLHCLRAGCLDKVITVVGPDSPERTLLTARILTFYRLPQISYSAKDEIFTNKNTFPLLFRMLPSENFQISGIITLLETFNWKWVSAVGNGTKASQESIQTLIAQANQKNICISYQSVMSVNSSVSDKQLRRVIENIQRSQTNVTIILSDENVLEKFFSIVVELKITGKVWIAPENWVLSHLVASIPGIGATGTILGLTIKPIKLDKFTWFVEQTLQCTPSNATDSPLLSGSQQLEELWGCSQACDDGHLLSPKVLEGILNSSIWHWSFYSYAAVYTLAHTLHGFLGCHLETCQVNKKFEPWQLYEKLHKADFRVQNTTIKFNDKGELYLGYNVITWTWEDGKIDFKTIGNYSSDILQLDWGAISWAASNGQIPRSKCISVCGVGQTRSKQMLDECSCRCDPCQEGTFQNQSDAEVCSPCPSGMWSPAKSGECFYPYITYLDMKNINVFALVIATVAGFCLLFGCLLVFATHWQTPVVKAAGGKLAFVMLASLMASCATTSLFIGRPTSHLCLIRQPFFAISFTLCVSCLLVRAFQIIFIFKMACRFPRIYKYWVKYKGTYCTVALSTGLQGVLCLLWLYFSPPTLQRDIISDKEIFLRCLEGNYLGLGSVLGYIMVLGGACFVFAFLGRKLPKNYSEARLLAVSMLVFLMGWGCFMLIYITTEGRGKQIAALQMFTVQTSVYAILCTFFLPKCYIILFKPQYNTVAHFQTCIQAYTTTAYNTEQ